MQIAMISSELLVVLLRISLIGKSIAMRKIIRTDFINSFHGHRLNIFISASRRFNNVFSIVCMTREGSAVCRGAACTATNGHHGMSTRSGEAGMATRRGAAEGV